MNQPSEMTCVRGTSAKKKPMSLAAIVMLVRSSYVRDGFHRGPFCCFALLAEPPVFDSASGIGDSESLSE